jgi:glycosyltransferase involved in cell wall biosynthesis
VGTLAALGLITPQVYDRDTTLRRLIDVMPYGVQVGRPQHTHQVLKGVVPGIRETDTVLIWNGSIMEWFDAKTVIQAMVEVSRARDDVKLFFLGVEHPDWVTGMLFDPPREAVALSKQLGLYERSVFFNAGWVPYQEIGNYLAESDIGVCAGFDDIESRYAFRTRFVDLFWAELPIVCTRGDVLAERVERDELGIAVSAGDAQAFAAAVLRLVKDEELYRRCRGNISAVKEELSWERVLAPLVAFCRSGWSGAAPKRQRLLPLLQRSSVSSYAFFRRGAEGLLAHARQM